MSKPLFYGFYFYSQATSSWSRDNHALKTVAIVSGIILALVIALLFSRGRAVCLLPIFGLLGYAVVWYIGQKLSTPRLSKWIALDLVDAHRLVKHLLQTKGLPFQDRGMRFCLEGSDLTIHLDKGYLQNSRTLGTIITLTPLHPDNLPLADSLSERIDEALKPRGLAL